MNPTTRCNCGYYFERHHPKCQSQPTDGELMSVILDSASRGGDTVRFLYRCSRDEFRRRWGDDMEPRMVKRLVGCVLTDEDFLAWGPNKAAALTALADAYIKHDLAEMTVVPRKALQEQIRDIEHRL